MKRYMIRGGAAVCAILLSACGDGSVDHVNSRYKFYDKSVFPPQIVGESSAPAVEELTFPYIISQNNVKMPDGTTLCVNVEMTEGEYFDQHSPQYRQGGGIYDTNYAGLYHIAIYTDTDSDEAVYTMPVSFDSDRMNFDRTFSLVFDDYNNDGNPDFTLGQWADGNGNSYQIFTVLPDGEIQRLACEGLCATSFEYSIRLAKASPTSFSCEAYNMTAGQRMTLTYSWKDDAFVLKEK
ncbi:MAG: hypothetical protein ACERKO_04225 [Acetanaerobacterium sp.]